MDETLKQKRNPVIGHEVHRMAKKLEKNVCDIQETFVTMLKSAPLVKRMDETLKQKRKPVGHEVHPVAKSLKETLKGAAIRQRTSRAAVLSHQMTKSLKVIVVSRMEVDDKEPEN